MSRMVLEEVVEEADVSVVFAYRYIGRKFRECIDYL
jgi:hypothetical protein